MLSMARQYSNCLAIGASDDLDEIWSPFAKTFGSSNTRITALEDGSWFIDARHDGKHVCETADDEVELVIVIERIRISSPAIADNVFREMVAEFKRLDPAALRRTVKCAG